MPYIRTANANFYVEDGSQDREGTWPDGDAVMYTDNYLLCEYLNRYLWNYCGLTAPIRCQKSDEVPYCLVLTGKKKGSMPSPANIKLARAVCLAYARGLDNYCVFDLSCHKVKE
jgi:hypothetical protein